MLHRRLGFLAFAFLTLVSLLGSALIYVPKALAGPGPPVGTTDMVLQFLDRAHVEVIASGDYAAASGVYYDQDLNDYLTTGLNYKQGGSKKAGVQNGCQSEISVKKSAMPTTEGATVTVTGHMTMNVPAGAGGGGSKCTKTDFDIGITDAFALGGTLYMMGTDNSRAIASEPGYSSGITYFKADGNTISPADNDPNYDSSYKASLNFVADASVPVGGDPGTAYFLQSTPANGDCSAIAHADDGSPSNGHYYYLKKKNGKCDVTFKWTTHKADPAYNDQYNFNNVLVLGQRPDAYSTVAAGSSTSQGGKDDLCPISTWGLRWLACPLVTAAQEGVQAMDKILQGLLIVNTDDVFGPTSGAASGGSNQSAVDSSNAYYQGFKSFQSIALALLVIIALVMVVGQALGFELLDAYTMRKVLPRLVAMVIILVILWPGLRFIVGFFDDLTNWSGDIIAAPFRALGAETKTSFTAIATQYFVAGGAYLFLGPVGIIMLAGTLFLSILTLIVILLARKLIILLCIISAPIAVVCSILPNTRKVTKIWIDGFMPAEMAGPAIAATEGAGIAFAHIATASNIGGVGSTVAVVIVILDQFVLVVVVRRVGGFFSTVTGVVNDRSRGAFDRLRNARGNAVNRNMQALGKGGRFNNTSAFGRRFNDMTRGATVAARSFAASPSATPGSFGRKYRQASDQATDQHAAELMKSGAFQSLANNDDALTVADALRENGGDLRAAIETLTQRWGGDAPARDRAENAVAAVQASGIKFDETFTVAAAMQRVSTGTGYNDMDDMRQTLARAAGDNEAMGRRLSGFANAETKKVGRHDLAPSYGTLSGLVLDTQRGVQVTQQRLDAATVQAGMDTDNATLLRDKGGSVDNVARALHAELTRAQTTHAASTPGSPESDAAEARMGELMAKLRNIPEAGAYASESNVARVAGAQAGNANVVGAAQYVVNNQVNPTVTVYARDPATGQVQTRQVDNPNYAPQGPAAQAFNQRRNQRFGRPGDPNDMNMPQ